MRKEFGGIRAVFNCSFEVEEGSITGLIGPNGAGKTTVFNLISGFVQPDSGEITFEGRPIGGLPVHQVVLRGIVRTFQIPRELKDMTVIENLMLAARPQSGERIWNLWLRPGKVRQEEDAIWRRAKDVLEFLELSSLENERAAHLSVGQKKLLELGRGLMADPRLLLLDEPAAGVNPTLLRRIADYIRELRRRGTTFLLIEHNMDWISDLCDKIVVMNHGTRLTEGRPEEVRKNPAVIEAYMGA